MLIYFILDRLIKLTLVWYFRCKQLRFISLNYHLFILVKLYSYSSSFAQQSIRLLTNCDWADLISEDEKEKP